MQGSVRSDSDLPFIGLRVVEFCTVAAGPFCTMLLADMGADVIKIEPIAGDTLRQWPPITDGFSENFASLNRNKRSIALDLKDPVDWAVALRLVEKADIVVENNRPGAMARLGLSYETFAERMPKLIYCSLSAFGQAGPRSADGGFDLTVQAMSGIMSVTGEMGGNAVKCGVPVSDFSTGLYGAFAIAALVARVRSGGSGGHIDVSMLGSSLAISALQVSEYFGSGIDPRPLGTAHPRNAPYQAFAAVDGQFAMAAGNNKLWLSVCTIVERPDLAADPRFQTPSDRSAHQADLASILNGVFARRTLADLLAAFALAGVPAAPINRFSEALADSQVEFMNWVQPLELPNGTSTRTFGPSIRIDGRNAPITRVPPALDADRAEILAELEQPQSVAAQ